MAIRIFCGPATTDGYLNNPADSFHVSVPYRCCASSGGESDGPRYFDEFAVIPAGLSDTVADIYAAVFDEIESRCATLGYPTPTHADVFFHEPLNLTTLLGA